MGFGFLRKTFLGFKFEKLEEDLYLKGQRKNLS
jgi:hypothetical protein